MRLKHLLILFISLLLITVPCVALAEGESAVQNGDFALSSDGIPDDWMCSTTAGDDDFFGVEDTDGKFCFIMQHTTAAHSSLWQFVQLEAGVTYKFSCEMLCDVPSEMLSDVTVYLGESAFALTDLGVANGQLGTAVFYFTPDTAFTPELRFDFGGANDVTGYLRIADIILAEYDGDIPTAAVTEEYSNDSYYDDTPADDPVQSNVEAGRVPVTVAFVLTLIALIAIVILITTRMGGRFSFLKPAGWVAVIVTTGVVVKMIFSMTTWGYYYDMTCFVGWGEALANGGLSDFYTSGIFADYPPGYMYILAGIGKLAQWFGCTWGSPGYALLIKLPSILADAGIALIVYRMGREYATPKISVLLSAVVMFNPAFLIDGQIWGQVDAVLLLLLISALWLLLKKQRIFAALVFMLAILIKPQALILGPVFILPYIRVIFCRKTWWRALLESVAALAAAAALFVLLVLPFSGGHGIGWVADKYFGTALSYPYASVNAFNIYALFGGNWLPSAETFLFMPLQYWGYLLIALGLAGCCFLYFRSRDERSIFLVGALFFALVFMTGPNMHERYMVPAVYLAVAALACRFDMRLMLSTCALTVATAINILAVFVSDHYTVSGVMTTVGSVLMTAAFLYFTYASVRHLLSRDDKLQPAPELFGINESTGEEGRRRSRDRIKERIMRPLSADDGRRMNRRDWLIACVITVVYGVVAFINLGSFAVPQSGYDTVMGQTAAVSFSKPEHITTIKFYGGIGRDSAGSFALSYSGSDGYVTNVTSSDDVYANGRVEYQPGQMYTWIEIPTDIVAQTVYISCTDDGFPILEMAFTGENGIPLPVSCCQTTDGGDASALTDEQALIPVGEPTYMDEMYFDEIYHARTAYEHINGIYPYETTHPPLGKLLIAVGINIFGMVPFGWRFMSTLFGVLMLPLMYVFAKRLFKKPLYAALPTLLFAFDFMHHVQTRLAVIDSFAIFFIMLMYYFMYLYTERNYNTMPLGKTLLPLLLCGISFGLGAATKWLCIYAGVGLAVIFFYQVYKRSAELRYASAALAEGGLSEAERSRCETVTASFRMNTLKTILFCVLVFIILPLGIYTLAYVPVIIGTSGFSFRSFLENQSYMLTYHGRLVVDSPHAFYSKWYTWPFDILPVYYYKGYNLPDGYLASIACFGNPAVFLGGIIAAAGLVVLKLRRRPVAAGVGFIAIAALSEYVPWIFVSRGTFMYHFFATVPFLILLIAYFCVYLCEHNRHGRKIVIAYLAVVAILFCMFYPVITGVPVLRVFSDNFLKWLPGWPFY